jgi:short-subunit dehydrogenase
VAEKAKETSPEEVAKQGFEALMENKDRVVAGNAATKLEGAAARFVPESVKADRHRKMAEPGSAKK